MAPKDRKSEGNEPSTSTSSLPAVRKPRIVFGSCNSQYYEQPFWDVIRERHPAAFVWAGDAVYADDQSREPWSEKDPICSPIEDSDKNEEATTTTPSQKISYATPEYLREVLASQLEVEGYKQLLEDDYGGGKISIFGAIDDHDYGLNNGDKSFPFRKENGIEFTKFLGLTKESSAMARRAAEGLGVYGVQVHDFSPSLANPRLLSDSEAGLDPDVVQDLQDTNWADTSATNRLVAVFVLDVRSNKTPWVKTFPERYSMDPEGDFLGEDQWKWFEEAIGRSNASVNIVVSGVQVHAPWFYDSNKVENWSGFPRAQHRLYQALLQPNVRAPILVSGDIHFAQLLRKDCRTVPTTQQQQQQGEDPTTRSITRSLYEVTTSGMTHSWGSKHGYCGRLNKSKMCTFYPMQTLVRSMMKYAHFAIPWTAIVQSSDSSSSNSSTSKQEPPSNMKQLQYALDRNVAEFEFDWTDDGIVTLRILGESGETLLREDWSMNRLTTSSRGNETTMLDDAAFGVARDRLEASLGKPLPTNHDRSEFVCANYRGNPNRVHFALGIVSTIGLFAVIGMSPFVLCLYIIVVGARRFRRKEQ